MRLYFDIAQVDAKQEISNAENIAVKNEDISDRTKNPNVSGETKPQQEPEKNIPIKMQGGGMFHTRKLRSNLINKTFKIHF
jgi:hypothetical protein